MDYAALEPHLHELKLDLRAELARKAEIDTRVASLQSAIDGIEGLIGPQPDQGPQIPGMESRAKTNGKLVGTPAIRELMRESPATEVWSPRALYKSLAQRSWLSEESQHPLRGVEAAINRMWKRGEIERVSPGRYRRVATEEEV